MTGVQHFPNFCGRYRMFAQRRFHPPGSIQWQFQLPAGMIILQTSLVNSAEEVGDVIIFLHEDRAHAQQRQLRRLLPMVGHLGRAFLQMEAEAFAMVRQPAA